MLTEHARNMSIERKRKLKEIGVGKTLDRFIWDKGHKNGAEIHTVTTTGLIIVQNERTNNLVTVLIARPQQIKRYYEYYNKPINPAVKAVLSIAREHTAEGFNLL